MSKITNEMSEEVEKKIIELENNLKEMGRDISVFNAALHEGGAGAVGFRDYTAVSIKAGEVSSNYANLLLSVAGLHRVIEKFDTRPPKAGIGGGGK